MSGSASARGARDVVTFGLAILVIALLLDWSVLGLHLHDLRRDIPACVLLAAAFAVAEFAVLHIERGDRHTFSVSLSELPLIIGLFSVPATGLVAARVVGAALVLSLVRKQPLTKLVFNVCSFAMEVTLAAIAVGLMPGARDDVRHIAPAALVAVAVAAAWQTTAVVAAITLYDGTFKPTAVLGFCGSSVVEAAACWIGGMVLIGAVHWDPWTLPFILAVAGVLVVAYRGYARLRLRHQSLELLYDFTRRLTSASRSSEEQLTDLFRAIAGLLQADSVELVLLDDDDTPRRLVLVGDSEVTQHRLDTGTNDPWLDLLETRSAVVIPARGSCPSGNPLLRSRGARDLVVLGLPTLSGVRGVLGVWNRLGDVTTFSAEDGRLLETVTAQVATAFQNSRLVQRLDHESRHDPLTGLANRVHFNERLDQALEGGNGSIAVLLLDLDRFKEVNDTLGHHIGDLLLEQVATRLIQQMRPKDLLARLGGDEFAIFLLNAGEEIATSVGKRIGAALEEPLTLDGISVEVAASIGVALSPQHGESAVTLLQRADVAMYQAKRTHNGVEVYDEELDGYSPRRLAIATELRHAIEHGDLEVYYQAQADVRTGQVVGAEALVRWNHPEFGLISPVEFIPVAEQTAQIQDLTYFVLASAVAECAAWRREGRELSVAVNLSVRNLLDTGLPAFVLQCVRDSDLPTTALTLEITESHIMADPERTLGVLGILDNMGVRLSVDDFGTGYSSLAYLRQMPVREVKIDRSFVTNLVTDSGDQAFVRTIVSLARSLDLDVVAEGVEDELTWRKLRSLGCTFLQGFYLSRPIPASTFRAWVAEYATQNPLVQPAFVARDQSGSRFPHAVGA